MPLSARVIFCGWHGVLSREPFWTSIRDSATHPLHEQLKERMAWAFTSNIADDWMKGLLSSDQVIAGLDIHLRGRLQDNSSPAAWRQTAQDVGQHRLGAAGSCQCLV